MKYGARSLMLLVMFTACSPSSQTAAERAAAAARADSSAAGYDVGPEPTASTHGPSGADSLPKGTVPSTGSGDRPSGGTPKPVVQADPVTPVGTTIDTGRTQDTSGRGASSGSRGSGSPVIGSAGRDSSVVGIPPLDPALEPDFIAYDTTRKTVTFQLAAGDEIRDQVSFNGVQRGNRTLTVPLGWRATIAFANRDPQLPHSVMVVDVSGPIPEQLPEPVFPRAQTVRTDEGLLEGDADEIVFTADRVGRYLIACGVLGHAQRGQWIALNVSTTAARPTYR